MAVDSARNRYDVLIYGAHIGKIIASRAEVIPTGGAETQLFLLGREMAKRGYRVAVVCLNVKGGIPANSHGMDVIIRPEYPKVDRRAWSPVRAFRVLREILYLLLLARSLGTSATLQRGISRETIFLAIGSKLAGARMVWASASDSDYDRWRLRRPSIDWPLFRLGVRLADSVVVQTPHQVQQAKERLGVVPGRIPSLCEMASDSDRRTRSQANPPLVWVGRDAPYKRPLEFVKLAASAPDLDFRMVFAAAEGEPTPESFEVRRLAATLANLQLLDPMPRDELSDLLANALAVVNTSEFEGMPNVFLEAWARGVPALSMYVDPGNLLSDRQLGYFVGGDAEALLSEARKLREDPSKRDNFADRVRDYVREVHSIDGCVDQWLPILIPAAARSTGG